MSEERFKQGMKNLEKIDGSAGKAVINSLSGLSGDIGKYIVKFAFGDIYDRQGLTLQEREMITITSLLTQGDVLSQLEVHIKAALHVGISKEKIIETFIQTIPYVGFPKVLNAVNLAMKIFDEDDSK